MKRIRSVISESAVWRLSSLTTLRICPETYTQEILREVLSMA